MKTLADTDAKELLETAMNAGQKRLQDLIDGNGIHRSTVRISQKEMSLIPISIHCRYDVKPVFHEKHKFSAENAQRVQNRQALEQKVAEHRARLLSPEAQDRIKTVLQDNSYGLVSNKRQIPLEKDSLIFVLNEICQACQGQKQDTCATCHGHGEVPCNTCKGRGGIMCQVCDGRKYIPDNNGNMQSCHECRGFGETPCSACQGRKHQPCQKCQSTGQSTCSQCDGRGSKDVVIQVIFHLEVSANADYKTPPIVEIPADLPAIIQNQDIKIMPDAEYDGQVIQFQAVLPAGQVSYSLNGKRVDAVVYGCSGQIKTDKKFMDSLVKPGIAALNKIVRGPMATGALFKRARSYRMIKDVTDRISYQKRNKVLSHLRDEYPIGLSDKYAKALIIFAEKSLGKLTARPRLYASFGLLALWGGVFALWFMAGLRPTAMSPLFDIILVIISVFASIYGIRKIVQLRTRQLFETKIKVPLPRLDKNSVLMAVLLVTLFLAMAALSGTVLI